MSQAVHVMTDHAAQAVTFECPQCGARETVASEDWREVPVVGVKPTLGVCEHEPHIPPSPAAIAALERARIYGG